MNHQHKANLQKTWDNDARHKAIIDYILDNTGFVRTTLKTEAMAKSVIHTHLRSLNPKKSKKLYEEAERKIESGEITYTAKQVGNLTLELRNGTTQVSSLS